MKESCLPDDLSGILEIKPHISIRYVTIMRTEPEDFVSKQYWYTCGQRHGIQLQAEADSAAAQLTQHIAFHRSKRNCNPSISHIRVLGVHCVR